MRVSVIIPTLNAEQYLEKLLTVLFSQTQPAEIIVTDSGSEDRTVKIVKKYSNQVKLLQVSPDCYDHGGTRDFALRESTGEYVLFLTQDALPTDQYYIERILQPFQDSRIAAVCGRQTAYADAPAYEKLTREFNYPQTDRVWSKKDIERLGVKAYFFSDACSAYRRSAYEAVGGFDRPILTNEDMMMAGKLLHGGYFLAYKAEAAVYHSHKFTLRQEYRRNAAIGCVMEQYRLRLRGAKSDREGLRMIRYVTAGLLRQKKAEELPYYILLLAAKFLGNRTGKRQYRGQPQ